MNYKKGKLEQQARCPHEHLSKEVVGWQKSGDKICNNCDETFAPGETIIPVPYRTQMIITAHALLVALRANEDLELKQNVKSSFIQYDWALVSKTTGKLVILVAHDVAEDCKGKGYC
jgi:hypothetical protein